MANAADSRWLAEAKGTMAIGDTDDVIEYAERLRDLKEFGMAGDLEHLKSLADRLAKAEQARKNASRAFHDAAEKLLEDCIEVWGPGAVIVALFGKRK